MVQTKLHGNVLTPLQQGSRGAHMEGGIEARGYATAKSGSRNASRGISAINSRTGALSVGHPFSVSAALDDATRGDPAVDVSATARDLVRESG